MTDNQYGMTEEQAAFCVRVAQWMDRIKTFPGGIRFLNDLFLKMANSAGLTLIDETDPTISLRREITQELYAVLWETRELRKVGYTMQTARKLGMEELYATHGSRGLVRYIEVATDAALHNAGLEGFSRSAPETFVTGDAGKSR